MQYMQIRGFQSSCRVSNSSPTSNIDFLNLILKKVHEVNSVQNNVKKAASARKTGFNNKNGNKRNINNKNRRNDPNNRRNSTSYQASSNIDIATLDASSVANNFNPQQQARNNNRARQNNTRSRSGNANRNKDIRVYQQVATQSLKPSEYMPQHLSPGSLLKYSSLVPVNKEMRVLNAVLLLLNNNKNGNVEFFHNEELLSNIGTLMKIQQQNGKQSQLYAEPVTTLASSVNRSISEIADNNLSTVGCVRPMRHFSNILKECQLEKEDLQLFREIVNGSYSELDDTEMLKKLPKQTQKAVMNLEVAKRSLNNNGSFDTTAKLKAFAPCCGVSPVKELVKNN